MDLIGALPLELVLLVFEYLHYTCLYDYRRVSRRWKEVLSSKDLLQPIISAQLHAPPWASADVYAKRSQAFRAGRPFQDIRFRLKGFAPPEPRRMPYAYRGKPPATRQNPLRLYALHGPVFAWVSTMGNSQTCSSCNLQTGRRGSFVLPGQQRAHGLTLSDHHMAVLSSSAYVTASCNDPVTGHSRLLTSPSWHCIGSSD